MVCVGLGGGGFVRALVRVLRPCPFPSVSVSVPGGYQDKGFEWDCVTVPVRLRLCVPACLSLCLCVCACVCASVPVRLCLCLCVCPCACLCVCVRVCVPGGYRDKGFE